MYGLLGWDNIYNYLKKMESEGAKKMKILRKKITFKVVQMKFKN